MNAMLDDMVQGLSGEICHPLRIMYGAHHLKILQNLSRLWHEKKRYSILFQIAQAHHILNSDNPQECNRHIIRFKDTLQEGSII